MSRGPLEVDYTKYCATIKLSQAVWKLSAGI